MILAAFKRINPTLRLFSFNSSNLSQRTFGLMFATLKDSNGGYSELEVKDRADWRQWLGSNQATDGIWLRISKKSSRNPSVSYDDALEEALCHGWIDGQRKSRDSETFLQKFTPRRAKSQWSERNKEIAKRLEREGRLTPAGISEIDRAKKEGRWGKQQ